MKLPVGDAPVARLTMEIDEKLTEFGSTLSLKVNERSLLAGCELRANEAPLHPKEHTDTPKDSTAAPSVELEPQAPSTSNMLATARVLLVGKSIFTMT